MILVDSSAWVEYIRRTGTSTHRRLRQLLDADNDEIVTTEVVYLEVLAGARNEMKAVQLRRMLGRYELMPLEGLVDFEQAAALYRTCRQRGETVRGQADCLIAAVAIRVDAEVLHNDRDFETIARYSPLRLAT